MSIQYPLVELVTLIIFAYGYWVFPFLGWSLNVPHWDLHEFVRYMHSMIFISLLLVCSVIDLRLMIIPDVISLPMIAMTPLIALVHPDLDMKSALIGVVLGGGFLYFVAWAYWLIRKEYGMGFGDVKLLAAIGGWLGYQAILPTLFIGSMVGSVVGIVFLIVARRFSFKAQIPFGPFLAVGAVTYLWWGPLLFTWLTGG